MSKRKSWIPESHLVSKVLEEVLATSQIIVISGLPGVGKSLYINQLICLAEKRGHPYSLIQWDVARKAFETPKITALFPMGEGTVHDGLKLAAGMWLIDYLTQWVEKYYNSRHILLIEAPLVGHRFIELAQKQENMKLEQFLSSDRTKFIMPIPSKKVRKEIEEQRKIQVSDEAHSWMGAKPSVMLQLWKQICEIAGEMRQKTIVDGQPPYDPSVYEYVFSQVLKHRHLMPIRIEEIFSVAVDSEEDLHAVKSITATGEQADHWASIVAEKFIGDEALAAHTRTWYKT